MFGKNLFLFTLLCSPFFSITVFADDQDEPGKCLPACRSRFMCLKGACISLCNPPCRSGEQCVNGECELMPQRYGDPGGKKNYLAMAGVFHGAITKSAHNLGELRVDIGGQYTSLEVGPAFGRDSIAIRAAISGHIPFQPFPRYPILLIPTIALGYSYSWLDDANESRRQDLFIVPGLRIRYTIVPRMAVFFEPIQLCISYLRLASDKNTDIKRVSEVPVSWNLALGVAFLY
jgi:hypothetical protein